MQCRVCMFCSSYELYMGTLIMYREMLFFVVNTAIKILKIILSEVSKIQPQVRFCTFSRRCKNTECKIVACFLHDDYIAVTVLQRTDCREQLIVSGGGQNTGRGCRQLVRHQLSKNAPSCVKMRQSTI